MFYAIDMAQSIDGRNRSNDGTLSDTPTVISRFTVPEAAQALGISPEAVRNRLSRGTLNSEKEDGTVYVLIPADKVRHTSDRSRSTDDTPSDRPENLTSVISAKDETIRVLSEQLESERTASAELRRIVAGLVQRVPELEASPEKREAPETASQRSYKANASREPQEPSQRRSWWRRVFGVE